MTNSKQLIITTGNCFRFGDVWMSINAALAYANGNVATIKLKNNIALAHEIKASLRNADNLSIAEYDGVYDIKIGNSTIYNYTKTKVQWKFGPYKRICYQLDGGRYKAVQKTPPNAKHLLNMLPHNVTKIKLGLPLSVTETIDLVSKSDLFVGIDSGMSHLCHSVNIPMFLIEHKYDIDIHHGNKKFTKCIGIDDAIKKINVYMNKIYKV
jgi:hypothetical protein